MLLHTSLSVAYSPIIINANMAATRIADVRVLLEAKRVTCFLISNVNANIILISKNLFFYYILIFYYIF